jgi:ribonuclease VapC
VKRAAIDASAFLAYLGRETGGELVGEYLRGSLMSAVNYSEVLQKTLGMGAPVERVQAAARAFQLAIVPFDAEAARGTAELAARTAGRGVSLADRACLALGMANQLPIITADRAWRDLELGVEIVLIRGGDH